MIYCCCRQEQHGSAKWADEGWNPDVSPECYFSVADMELKNPPEIIEGLKNIWIQPFWGYTVPTDAYLNAVCT